jgi:DNA-binding transcriptional ArsR family regulator
MRYIPCIQAPSSDPWRRVGRSSRRWTSRRRQLRPIINVRCRSSTSPPIVTYHSEVLEGTGLLDVLERGSQILQFQIHSLLGRLGVLDSLHLERINGLQLAADIVGNGLEGLEALLDLVDDGLVLQGRSVGGEVDSGRLVRQLLDLAAGILIALLEGLKGGNGLATEAQRAGDLGPVELESCASLLGREEGKISSSRLDTQGPAAARH